MNVHAAKRPEQHEAVRELISYMETTKLYNVIGSSSSDITKWKEAEYACCGDHDTGILRGHKRWSAGTGQDKRYYKFRLQCNQMLDELHRRCSAKRAKKESVLHVDKLQ